MTKPNEAFVQWCKKEEEEVNEIKSYNYKDKFLIDRGKTDLENQVRTLKTLNERIKVDDIEEIFFPKSKSQPESESINVKYTIDGELAEKRKKYVKKIRIENDIKGKITFSNFKVQKFGINLDESDEVNIALDNCEIANLNIVHGTGKLIRLWIRDTIIGSLSLSTDSIRHFEMEGGCLLYIECPPPGLANPFAGWQF